MMKAESPEEMFGEIVAYVEEVRGLLARGEWVELKGLDGNVKRVCDAVAALSPEQAKEYLPELEYLLDLVGELGHEMQAMKGEVLAEMKDSGNARRANKAYVQGKNLKGSES